MYSQKRRDLEQTISQLEADKAKLKKQIISAAARSRRSEQQCELAESKFSELERSTEDLHLQYNNLQASYNALTAQLEQAEKRTSAATTQAAAMESQLSKIKVIGCCGSRQYIFSIISF
jgi:chromosome segregation ATPase